MTIGTILRRASFAASGLSGIVMGVLGALPAQAQAPTTLQLEEIIVTAQKRAENIRDVPLSISVVGEAQLDAQHATQLTDYAAYVPGLQVVGGGAPGFATVALRGIVSIGGGAAVGTYIDETPLGSSGLYQNAASFSLDLLPYDIARVEVLRGPQGTLYGASSMGGLLKYVTRAPNLSEREFRIGGGVSNVKAGSDPGWNGRVGVNLPLVEGRLGLRASYTRNEIAGFIDNTNGKKDVNDGTQESARLALLWQASDAISLNLSAIRQTIDTDNFGQVALNPVTRQPPAGDLTNNAAVDEPFEKEVDLYSATLNWDLGWADFISASGYSDTRTDRRLDFSVEFGLIPFAFSGGVLAPAVSFFDQGLDLEKFTQEFRLTSKSTGAFEWQVGAFYTKEKADNSQTLRLLTLSGASYVGFDPALVATIPSDYKEVAVFGNASYKFTDRFKLSAGVRGSRDDQDFAQIVSAGILAPIATSRGSSDEDIFTWMVSPQFQLTDNALLYARAATGYQPGGPNFVIAGLPPAVDASTLTSYEVGLKLGSTDGRLLFDLSVYRIDWKDIQVPVAVGGIAGIVNGAEAASSGLELSAVLKPTERLQLGINLAYADATLSDDLPAVSGFRSGLKDDRLPGIPEFSWSATADYGFPLGSDWEGHVGGGFRWVGEREAGLSNTNPRIFPAGTLDSYNALDLNADVGNEHWTVRAYVKNLTDERAYLNIAVHQDQIFPTPPASLVAVPIQPRTVGVELDFKF